MPLRYTPIGFAHTIVKSRLQEVCGFARCCRGQIYRAVATACRILLRQNNYDCSNQIAKKK